MFMFISTEFPFNNRKKSYVLHTTYRLVLLLALGLFSTSIWAKKKDTIFPDITPKMLSDNEFAPDQNANAVVLADVGHFNSNDLLFHRHLRIKILKKAGLSWGNFSFHTPSKGMFHVKIYNLDHGVVNETKAGNAAVYRQWIVGRYDIYRVVAPDVRVGSIIDVEYTHRYLPEEWKFQYDIPVVYSDLTIDKTPVINYSKHVKGFEPVQTVSPIEWRAQNVPAFVPEPYCDAENYRTAMQIQITKVVEYEDQYRWAIWYAGTSWKSISRILLNNEHFKNAMEVDSFLNDIAKKVNNSDKSDEDKMWMAYRLLRDRITWNGIKSFLTSGNSRFNFQKNHSGNSADINLCMVALLRKCNFKAYPVVLSTRDNGYLTPALPYIEQLNYVVACAFLNDKPILMDATNKKLSPGILPDYCLNGKGLIVWKDDPAWISLDGGNKDIERCTININLDGNVSPTATVNRALEEYAYYNWQNERDSSDYSPKLFEQRLMKQYPDVEVTNYQVEKVDSTNLLANDKVEVKLDKQVQKLPGIIVYEPFVMTDFSSNPFTEKERKFPVDLNYPRERTVISTTQIPDGFAPDSLPSPARVRSEDGSLEFNYLTQRIGNQIQCEAILKFNKSFYTEKEYPILSQFMSQVSKDMNQSIVLKKNNIK